MERRVFTPALLTINREQHAFEVKSLNAYKVLDLPVTATKAEVRAAYRTLARRWHPDRFLEGPERDWANEKMAEINAANHSCLKGAPAAAGVEADRQSLLHIQEMIDDGHYHDARSMLMNISTRCAEWNYLFGAVLLKMCELQKAMIYLEVAAHQRPDVAKYAQALGEAKLLADQARPNTMRSRLTSFINRMR